MNSPPRSARRLRTALALVLAFGASATRAHDTWFEALSSTANPGGLHLLALGTGNQVPKHEFAVAANVLVRQACVDTNGRSRALQPQLQLPTRLLLRTTAPGAMTCWAQLTPFDIELEADKLALYFEEIRPSPAVLAAWAALQARGLPWRERYTKYARIELPGAATTWTASASPPVLPPALPPALELGMDLQPLADASQMQAGDRVAFKLLRDGKPFAGLWLELRSDASQPGTFGLWAQTDAAGLVQFTLPKAGAWVLRGTELRLAADDNTRWDSRFVTLAFQVQPKP